MTSIDKPETSPNYEKSIKTLEEYVGKLENGDLNLEESLRLFETSIRQTREAQQVLAKAEQRVQTLMNKDEVLVTSSLTESGSEE